jgi:hypothetical protein
VTDGHIYIAGNPGVRRTLAGKLIEWLVVRFLVRLHPEAFREHRVPVLGVSLRVGRI